MMRVIKRFLHKPLRTLMPIGCGLLLCSLIGLAGLPVSSQPVQANAGLSMSPNPNELTIAQQVDDQQINLGQSFQALGVDGSIVIYDKNNDRFYEHNPSRNTAAFFPASTFKIFNALVSLETGVIPNDVAVLTWDGIKRELPGVGEVPAWNRDTNLRQAFKDSTIWFYQVLARKNGHERMQQFIDQAGYGNRQIGTEQQIDRFWLDGPLQITPKQHIEFLERLDRNDLPFSERTLALVKDIMLVEQTPNYTLRGKTGWDTSVTPNIGWFVGYLEQNNNKYFFATNIMMPSAEDAAKRLEVTRRSFKALGLL